MKMTDAQRFWAKADKASKLAAKASEKKHMAEVAAYQTAVKATGKTAVGQIICKL